MTDPELSKRVREHYAGRAFSPSLVSRLCAEIERRSGPSGVEIAKGWWVATEPLIGAFEPIDQATRPSVLHASPAAILTLTFGYRLESPTARFPEDRQPGPNNVALALMTERCHRLFPDAWVATQYEVGLALRDRNGTAPDLVTPARDWNTTQVIEYFVECMPGHALNWAAPQGSFSDPCRRSMDTRPTL